MDGLAMDVPADMDRRYGVGFFWVEVISREVGLGGARVLWILERDMLGCVLYHNFFGLFLRRKFGRRKLRAQDNGGVQRFLIDLHTILRRMLDRYGSGTGIFNTS